MNMTRMQQEYYQRMRQQQVYRAYVAGIGSQQPEPVPTTYKFKVETEDNPPATLTIKIDGDWSSWDFNVPKTVLEGKTVEYRIQCDSDARPIAFINGEPVDLPTDYTNSVEMTEDQTITVIFGAEP